MQGRRPHWTFRGLLNVHWLLRPVGSPSRLKRPVCLEGSDGFVSSPRRFDSYRLERPRCRARFSLAEDQHLYTAHIRSDPWRSDPLDELGSPPWSRPPESERIDPGRVDRRPAEIAVHRLAINELVVGMWRFLSPPGAAPATDRATKLAPGVGIGRIIEPTRVLPHRILSPVRLPYSWYWKHVAVILKGFDCKAVTILP